MIVITKPLHLQVAGSSRPRFIKVRREGTLYDVDGAGVLEIFRVGVLCEALNRSRDRVLEWERTRLIPPPLFRVHGERWRFYGAAQIENVNRLVVARFGARRYVPASTMETFFDDIWSLWYQPAVIVDTEGNVDRTQTTAMRRPPAVPPKPRAARAAW
jgi:hypothetical protein